MKTKINWWIPGALLALSVVPVIAGMARLAELGRGAEVSVANARFFSSPGPVVLHIVSVTLFSTVGAFQFSKGFRHAHPRWHRWAGWLAAPMGLLAAISGLWMQATYELPLMDGAGVALLRWGFGGAMLVSLILALLALRTRKFAVHGAWMMRAYAIGMGAGTQVFTHLPWFVLAEGDPTPGIRSVMMGAGWVINLAVTEWVISRSTPVKKVWRAPAIA